MVRASSLALGRIVIVKLFRLFCMIRIDSCYCYSVEYRVIRKCFPVAVVPCGFHAHDDVIEFFVLVNCLRGCSNTIEATFIVTEFWGSLKLQAAIIDESSPLYFFCDVCSNDQRSRRYCFNLLTIKVLYCCRPHEFMIFVRLQGTH